MCNGVISIRVCTVRLIFDRRFYNSLCNRGYSEKRGLPLETAPLEKGSSLYGGNLVKFINQNRRALKISTITKVDLLGILNAEGLGERETWANIGSDLYYNIRGGKRKGHS